MILENFKTGWQKEFEDKIQTLIRLFPGIKIDYVKRHFGMLQIKTSGLDKDTQYIVDCVTYKIERESARLCEMCGSYGTRRDGYIPEMMCLCWKCYAIEIDSMESRNTNSES